MAAAHAIVGVSAHYMLVRGLARFIAGSGSRSTNPVQVGVCWIGRHRSLHSVTECATVSRMSLAAVKDAILGATDAAALELVAAYFKPGKFAGATFDCLGENPNDRFTADDIVAVTLLDVRLPPIAVRAILEQAHDELNALLARIPSDKALWEADVDLFGAYELWRTLREVPDIGPTLASKLLSRKRPMMLPIVDSVIRKSLRLENSDSWQMLRAVLTEETVRERIDALRPVGSPYQPTTLRLLDVATWMRFSESTAARNERSKIGLPVAQRQDQSRRGRQEILTAQEANSGD